MAIDVCYVTNSTSRDFSITQFRPIFSLLPAPSQCWIKTHMCAIFELLHWCNNLTPSEQIFKKNLSAFSLCHNISVLAHTWVTLDRIVAPVRHAFDVAFFMNLDFSKTSTCTVVLSGWRGAWFGIWCPLVVTYFHQWFSIGGVVTWKWMAGLF